MKLTSLYNDGDLSSLRVKNAEDTVSQVKNLLFSEQLEEERIILEIKSKNKGHFTEVDEIRLDFDRIWSKKQINRKRLFFFGKWMDSCEFKHDFPIETILAVKNEERFLNAIFRDYFVLTPSRFFWNKKKDVTLFVRLRNGNFYQVGSTNT